MAWIIKKDLPPDAPGRIKQVLNLGWLRRNWKGLASIQIGYTSGNPSRSGFECVLTAETRDGRLYMCEFQSYWVALDFIDRSIFRGLPLTITDNRGTEFRGKVGDAGHRAEAYRVMHPAQRNSK